MASFSIFHRVIIKMHVCLILIEGLCKNFQNFSAREIQHILWYFHKIAETFWKCTCKISYLANIFTTNLKIIVLSLRNTYGFFTGLRFGVGQEELKMLQREPLNAERFDKKPSNGPFHEHSIFKFEESFLVLCTLHRTHMHRKWKNADHHGTQIHSLDRNAIPPGEILLEIIPENTLDISENIL